MISHCSSGSFGIALTMLAALSTTAPADQGSTGRFSLYVDYSQKPDPQEATRHDLCIFDAEAEADLKPGQKLGHQYLAYVSMVEIHPERPSMEAARKRGVPFVGSNPDWHTEIMDVTSKSWAEFVLNDLAARAIARGYDGFFLDTLDSVALGTAKSPEVTAASHAALIGMIKTLHQRFPGKQIVINRGFPLLHKAAPYINGVLVEGLYQSWDATHKVYISTKPDGTSWLLTRIREIQQLQLPVYVLDYVNPTDEALARRTMQRIRSAGGIPFISTPDLQGRVLGITASEVNPRNH